MSILSLLSPSERTKSAVSYGAIAAALCFQILIFMSGSILAIVAGVSGSIVSVTAGVKQVALGNAGSLREAHSKVNEEVNAFKEENRKLTSTADEMEGEVSKLNDVEETLTNIAAQSGCSATELQDLVNENRATLKEQRALTKTVFQEQLLAAVLSTDRNGDFQIDEREANVLMLRMKNQGIEFNEDKVRAGLLKTNGSMGALLEIIRDLAEDDDKEV